MTAIPALILATAELSPRPEHLTRSGVRQSLAQWPPPTRAGSCWLVTLSSTLLATSVVLGSRAALAGWLGGLIRFTLGSRWLVAGKAFLTWLALRPLRRATSLPRSATLTRSLSMALTT